MQRLHTAVFASLLLVGSVHAQKPFKPTAEELAKAYQSANQFQARAEGTLNLSLTYGWFSNGDMLWYRCDKADGKKEFIKVDCFKKAKAPLFDHTILAKALSEALKKEIKADALPFQSVTVDNTGDLIDFRAENKPFRFNTQKGTLEENAGEFDPSLVLETTVPEESPLEDPAPFFGKYLPQPEVQGANVRVREGQVEVNSGGTWTIVSKQGGYARAERSQGNDSILAFRLIPGDRRMVYLLKSSIAGTSRATLEQRLYDQPGDKLDEFEAWLINPTTKTETKLDLAPIMGGGQPWSNPPSVRWRGNRGLFEFPVRGYQQNKVVMLDAETGKVKTVVTETSPTFIDQSKTNFWPLEDGKRILWQSERDGRCHLYVIDTETGDGKQITKGNWLVRGIVNVDEAKGMVWFNASGFGDSAKDDPYHLHLCRVKLDGSDFSQLTKGDGTHTTYFSPNRRYFLDTWSRVDEAPVHEVRDGMTGQLLLTLEKGNIDILKKNGVRLPERFVAKARDGKTDIWGIIVRPSNFDFNRKYPVIEYIYAGPHDSFVPKSFRSFYSMHRLAELGFIVVQVDGMGTNNRGKAFHDVCWKNIADSGFPDRILWMQALAKKYPQADIERVGIYGTSAGGQSSTGGILNFGDFYKVAVSSCGCHDNRIDKQWWNEQWMGYPVGAHYNEQSNITNARKLKGHLMLIVGEQDRNVPPETTIRLADALIKAQKEFELVVIPGADHTDGGPYGERKRRDFFVRWLHGVEPPTWNN